MGAVTFTHIFSSFYRLQGYVILFILHSIFHLSVFPLNSSGTYFQNCFQVNTNYPWQSIYRAHKEQKDD